MHIQRIQVPDFRALKNVDISFEKEFTPRIFPLGSQNGGGKSTLLQLIFTLLHCSANPHRVGFLRNLLCGFRNSENSDKKTLAIIDIWDGNQTVKLHFFTCNEFYITNLLNEYLQDPRFDQLPSLCTKISREQSISYLKIWQLQREIGILKTTMSKLNNIKIDNNFKENEEKDFIFDKAIFHTQNSILYSQHRTSKYYRKQDIGNKSINFKQDLNRMIERTQNQLNEIFKKLEEGENIFELKTFTEYLNEHKIIHLCDFFTSSNIETQNILLCEIDSLDTSKANTFLLELSNKIFLTAHISQSFIFLNSEIRKLLSKGQSEREVYYNDYYTSLKESKLDLPGLFTYDLFAYDTIIEAFKDARDQDFRQAIETGEYGNNYKILSDQLYAILVNKKVNIESDLSGINFKLDIDGTKLYPEDLSHGELKRLCIYTWMKHNKIEDAIVLMDELEISFHPDWQYQIVRDLEEWGATNQYILATHSYELCNAVTPAHVKELDPKLQARTIQ